MVCSNEAMSSRIMQDNIIINQAKIKPFRGNNKRKIEPHCGNIEPRKRKNEPFGGINEPRKKEN